MQQGKKEAMVSKRKKRDIYVRVLEEERQVVNDVIKITKKIKKHKVKEKNWKSIKVEILT